MSISKETLRAMIRDLHLIELSEEELDLIQADLESHMASIVRMRTLDLARVPSARQLRAREEGELLC